MTNVLLEIFFADRDTSVELAIRPVSIVLTSPYDVIEHRHEDISSLECSGSPILFMNCWTSWTSSNVVNPGKTFHSNSIGSASIVSKI